MQSKTNTDFSTSIWLCMAKKQSKKSLCIERVEEPGLSALNKRLVAKLHVQLATCCKTNPFQVSIGHAVHSEHEYHTMLKLWYHISDRNPFVGLLQLVLHPFACNSATSKKDYCIGSCLLSKSTVMTTCTATILLFTHNNISNNSCIGFSKSVCHGGRYVAGSFSVIHLVEWSWWHCLFLVQLSTDQPQ